MTPEEIWADLVNTIDEAWEKIKDWLLKVCGYEP